VGGEKKRVTSQGGSKRCTRLEGKEEELSAKYFRIESIRKTNREKRRQHKDSKKKYPDSQLLLLKWRISYTYSEKARNHSRLSIRSSTGKKLKEMETENRRRDGPSLRFYSIFLYQTGGVSGLWGGGKGKRVSRTGAGGRRPAFPCERGAIVGLRKEDRKKKLSSIRIISANIPLRKEES